MSSHSDPHTDQDKPSVGQFLDRIRHEMVPLSHTFCYFSAALSLSDEDVKEYLEQPIAAIPPTVTSSLPKTSILLVPYLEKVNGKERGDGARDLVSMEPPPDLRQTWTSQFAWQGESVLAFALQDREVADYHYRFYRAIAVLLSDHWNETAQSQFFGLLREELSTNIHGEVDEESWHLKQSLLRRQTNLRRETKAFREYARQSFVDTMTLYLHGICCDIDVETGPRQLPSRYLRKRLQLLHELYPPPDGYAVFPEELSASGE